MTHTALFALIQQEITKMRQEVDLLTQACACPAHPIQNTTAFWEEIQWIAVASLTEKLYMGWERIMKRIAVDVDDYLPGGESSHRDLVEQMGMAVGKRPAVFAPATIARLHALRAFRHRERNLYSAAIRKQRVREIAAQALALWTEGQRDLEAWEYAMEAPGESPSSTMGSPG